MVQSIDLNYLLTDLSNWWGEVLVKVWMAHYDWHKVYNTPQKLDQKIVVNKIE